MKTQKMKWLLILIVTIGLISATTTALANTIYLPVVVKYPTATPTLTQTPTATATLTPTPTTTPEPEISIIDIHSGSLEEQFIKLENTSNTKYDMTGWFIKREKNSPQPFRYDFPDDFKLGSDSTVTVWTKTGEDTSTNLYWDLSVSVWSDKVECAYLKDDEGNTISYYCNN